VTRVVVADAGPLIALAKIKRITLLQQLYNNIVIPPAVYSELQIDSGRPGANGLKQAINDGWLSDEQINEPSLKLVEELKLLLDEGEAQAIVLAEKIKPRFLLIDERRGRDIAKRRGIRITGTGAILVVAKRQGLIESVSDEIKALIGNGYRMSEKLQDKLKVLADE